MSFLAFWGGGVGGDDFDLFRVICIIRAESHPNDLVVLAGRGFQHFFFVFVKIEEKFRPHGNGAVVKILNKRKMS